MYQTGDPLSNSTQK